MIAVIHALILLWCVHQMRMLHHTVVYTSNAYTSRWNHDSGHSCIDKTVVWSSYVKILRMIITLCLRQFLYVRRIHNNLLQPERFTHPPNLPQRGSITTKKNAPNPSLRWPPTAILLDSSSLRYRSKASC